jgi:hypothetical protein
LIAKGYAVSVQPEIITPKPGMLKDLDDRAIGRVAQRLSAETGLSHLPIGEAQSFSGHHVRTIDLPTRRLAVIQGRNDFTLVPWRPELAKMRGKEIAIRIENRAITMSIAIKRDRGLSR